MQDENLTSGKVAVGWNYNLLADSYHPFLHDLDETMGLWQWCGPEHKNILILEGQMPLFAVLMKREDCKTYFINYVCDLMNGPFSAENVGKHLDVLYEESKAELEHTIDNVVGQFSMTDYEIENDTIKEFFTVREESIIEQLVDFKNSEGSYTLFATILDDCNVLCNSNCYLNVGTYERAYLRNNPVTLKAIYVPGYRVMYWLVNGEEYEGNELIITEEMIVDGGVKIELDMEDNPEANLTISLIKAKGADDYIVLTNTSLHSISTRGYFLSDDVDNLQKFMIPEMIVKAGEIVTLYGKNYSKVDSLGKIGINFSLKEGETLTLLKGKDTIVGQITIPSLNEGEIYEKDLIIGTFKKSVLNSTSLTLFHGESTII